MTNCHDNSITIDSLYPNDKMTNFVQLRTYSMLYKCLWAPGHTKVQDSTYLKMYKMALIVKHFENV